MTHDKFCAIWTSDEVCICGYLKDARADEREQAAQRVIDVETVGLCHPCAYDKATFVAAARGDVADKTGESTGGHGGLVSRASFLPSSAATVHNIDDPDAIVNVRNAAVVNINQTQNVNVWTNVSAARGGEQA